MVNIMIKKQFYLLFVFFHILLFGNHMMATLVSKRRRVEIQGNVQKQIFEMKINMPKVTSQELRQSIIKENNIDIGKSTTVDILKASKKWLFLLDE